MRITACPHGAPAADACPACRADAIGERRSDPGESTQRLPAFTGRTGRMAPRLDPMPAGLQILFEGIDGPARGATYEVRQRVVVIGREEGEFRIADPMISRRHACLEVHDAATIILRDLSSTNGTLHNGQLIAFTRVEDGDEIRMGASVLTLAVDRS